MGFFGDFFTFLFTGSSSSSNDENEGKSSDGRCCAKCDAFEGDKYEYEGTFHCTRLDKEIEHSKYERDRNIKEDCICNTYLGYSGNYFRWR